MSASEILRFLRANILLFLILSPIVLSLGAPETQNVPASDETAEEDDATRQMYYFYPTWLDSGDVHNWGFGQEGPGAFGHYLYQGQLVKVYILWTPTYGANFRIGFTDYMTGQRYRMTKPIYNGYTSLYAPFNGYFLIRIDNTYGGCAVTYDGWYIVYP